MAIPLCLQDAYSYVSRCSVEDGKRQAERWEEGGVRRGGGRGWCLDTSPPMTFLYAFLPSLCGVFVFIAINEDDIVDSVQLRIVAHRSLRLVFSYTIAS